MGVNKFFKGYAIGMCISILLWVGIIVLVSSWVSATTYYVSNNDYTPLTGSFVGALPCADVPSTSFTLSLGNKILRIANKVFRI